MDSFQTAILGIVQGLTEFLPVSSSGHLLLFPKLLGWKDPGLDLDAFLHLGTLAAVFIYFRDDLWKLITEKDQRPMLIGIILATLPVVAVGFGFKTFFESEAVRGTGNLAKNLIAGAAGLWIADTYAKQNKSIKDLDLKSIMLIGVFQCLALFPGVSRSGATIMAGLLTGLKREEAARFAFLVGIPAISGAGLLAVKDLVEKYSEQIPVLEQAGLEAVATSSDMNITAMILGLATSFISGWLAISFLIKFLSKNSTISFVIYRIVLGIVLLLFL